MSRESTSPPSPNTSHRRRSSFTELFQRQGTAVPPTPGSQPRPIYAAGASNAQAHQQRRMSLNTLGLSGSPTQVSSFASTAMRRASVSSSVMSTSPTVEQAVIEEPDEETPMTSPTTPFTRRVSFGTQALRGTGNGEGFNWAESLRIRAERAPSIGNFAPISPTMPHQGMPHQRSASIATMEGPPPEHMEPPKQLQPKSKPKPDYFQEKILRADFMD